MVALNYKKIGRHPESVLNVEPFMNKHNWQGIKYVSGKDDWAKFEKNNNAAVNVI